MASMMKTASLFGLLTFGIGSAAVACAQAAPADLVLKNANVYTGNEKLPRAQSVAIRGDRIVFAGSDADARRFTGPNTRVIDLGGATVVPGLADAHYHLTGVGEREMTLNLEGTTTKEAFLTRVKQRVMGAKPGEWITGRGWIETFWTPP